MDEIRTPAHQLSAAGEDSLDSPTASEYDNKATSTPPNPFGSNPSSDANPPTAESTASTANSIPQSFDNSMSESNAFAFQVQLMTKVSETYLGLDADNGHQNPFPLECTPTQASVLFPGEVDETTSLTEWNIRDLASGNGSAGPFALPNWCFAELNNITWPDYVTVVLDDGHIFKFSTAQLKGSSNYFVKALATSSNWTESQDGQFKMHDIGSHSLAVFKCWLENGYVEESDFLLPEDFLRQAVYVNGEISGLDDEVIEQNQPEWLVGGKKDIFACKYDPRLDRLVNCYLLGLYLHSPGFENAMIDEIMKQYANYSYFNDGVPLYNLPFICEHTSLSNPLRRLVIDMVYYGLSDETFALARQQELIPKAMILTLKDMMLFDPNGNDDKQRASHFMQGSDVYHMHPSGPMNSPCQDGWCPKGLPVERWDLDVLACWSPKRIDTTNYPW